MRCRVPGPLRSPHPPISRYRPRNPQKPIDFAMLQSVINEHVGLAVNKTVELCLYKWIIRSNTLVSDSTGTAPSDISPLVVGVTFDCAATHLVRVALLIPQFPVIVFVILGNLSLSLIYNQSLRNTREHFQITISQFELFGFSRFSRIQRLRPSVYRGLFEIYLSSHENDFSGRLSPWKAFTGIINSISTFIVDGATAFHTLALGPLMGH